MHSETTYMHPLEYVFSFKHLTEHSLVHHMKMIDWTHKLGKKEINPRNSQDGLNSYGDAVETVW